MSDGLAVAKVLNWLMQSRKAEVVNHSEEDNISVHGYIVSIKYVYFLSSPAKHKNLSTNRVLNDSCQILWSEKVTNSGFNNQQSVRVNAPSLSSNQHHLGSLGMKTDRNRRKNSSPIFVSIFLAETGLGSGKKNRIKNGWG